MALIRSFGRTPAGTAIIGCTVLALALRLFMITRLGYLTGVTEYDDGVYLGGAIRLFQGQLPYHDFAFVQPPGILLLLQPVALLTAITTATHALAAARILTVGASAACVPLAGWLVRDRGPLVTVVTCGILAVYPDDITTAHSLILEPWMNLILLIGAAAAFREGRLASPRRLLWAGVVIGAAGSVKFWAGLPAAVLLAGCLLSGRGRGRAPLSGRTWRYLAGLVIGFAVPVLPFALAGPLRFARSTVLDQAARDGTYVPRSMRLAHITGLIDFLDGHGRLTLRAGTHSLFASGGAAATPGTSAGWPPYIVFALAVALIAAGYWLRPGRPSPLEAFSLATAAIATGGIVFYSAFFYHYPDFGAPWVAIAAGGACGAVRAARSRQVLIRAACALLFLLAAFQAREISDLAAPDLYHQQAVIPAGACVVTDQASMTIAANRFTAARPGCPSVVDSLAQTLVLSGGVSVQGGAKRLENVAGAWQSILARADYVWLSPNNYRRIPWTPRLLAWFTSNFAKVGSRGIGTVYKRAGALPGGRRRPPTAGHRDRRGQRDGEQAQPGQHVEVPGHQLQAVPVVLGVGRVVAGLERGHRRVVDQPALEQAERRLPEVRPRGERRDHDAGQGVPGRPGPPPPGADGRVGQHRDPGDVPDPVVVPADRRGELRDQPGHHQAGERVPGVVQPRRGPQAEPDDDHGGGQPRQHPPVDAAGQPGGRAAQRLVLQAPDEPGPAGREEVAPQPERPRRAGERREPDSDAGGEGADGDEGLPEPLRDQQVQDEQARDELDPGGEPGGGAFPPALVVLAQVPHHQGHQPEFDLAEVEPALDRLGPQRDAAEQQGRSGAPGQGLPAQLPERDPDRGQQARHAHHRHQPEQRAEGQHPARGERQRRERGVGELDAGVALVRPGIQVRRVVQRLPGPAQVHREVEALQQQARGAGGQGGGVGGGREGGDGDAGDQQRPPGSPVIPLPGVMLAGQDRVGAHLKSFPSGFPSNRGTRGPPSRIRGR